MIKCINLKVKKASNFSKKLIGFMFKKNINFGLLFYKTKSIHTFFCKENLDIIFLDKNFKILYLFQNIGKNKIIRGKKAFFCLELPSSLNLTSNLAVEDILFLTNLEK